MRKEALFFVGTVISCIYLMGPISVAGLFIYGFVWLAFGEDS